MNQKLDDICNKFIANRDALKNKYKFEHIAMYPIGACMFTDNGKQVDINRLKECEDILKRGLSLFSPFRGRIKFLVYIMLAIDEDPEKKLDSAYNIYRELKKQFFSSPYLPLCAMILTDLIEPDDSTRVITKAKELYKLFKKEHYWLTSPENMVITVLLASSSMTNQQIIHNTESCYQLIQQKFALKTSVQSLSHVLALGEGTAEEKVDNFLSLYKGLKDRGYRYGGMQELSSLGAVSMLSDTNSIINDMIYVDTFLSKQRGYGLFGSTKRTRLLHSAMLLSSYYVETKNSSPMDVSVTSRILSTAVKLQMGGKAVATSSAASTNVVINNM